MEYDYKLGVFIEIDYKKEQINCMLFSHGEKYREVAPKPFLFQNCKWRTNGQTFVTVAFCNRSLK